MFNNLRDTIKALNSDVKDVANCKRAKALRKKLLGIGTTLVLAGIIGIITCLALFITAGEGAFTQNGFSARVLVPFILIIPFGLITGVGSFLVSLALKIVITGYTANLVDETVGSHCHNCGENIDPELNFCSKCGSQQKKECSVCKHQNKLDNNYCEKCGNKL